MKKIIRDSTSDVLMIISFTVSFFILWYLIPLFEHLYVLQDKSDGYNETYYYNIQTSSLYQSGMAHVEEQTSGRNEISFEVFRSFITSLEAIKQGNIYCYGNIELLQGVVFYNGKILIKQNEDIIEAFEDVDAETAGVVVKPSLDSYMKGKYLSVKGMDFQVDGYYKEEENTCALYMNMDKLDEQHKMFVLSEIYAKFLELPMIFYFAGENTLDEVCMEFQNICDQYHLEYEDITEEMKSDLNNENNVYKQINRFSLTLAFLLAVINCMNVSFLWMKRKRKEFAIRKAFGYTTVQMYIENLKSMFPLTIVSAVVSVLIYSLMYYLEKSMGVIETADMFSTAQIILILLGMFLVFALCSVPVMLQIKAIEPAQGISDWQ